MGCSGGYLDGAWDYARTDGVVTESCMPYISGGLAVNSIKIGEVGAFITKFQVTEETTCSAPLVATILLRTSTSSMLPA